MSSEQHDQKHKRKQEGKQKEKVSISRTRW